MRGTRTAHMVQVRVFFLYSVIPENHYTKPKFDPYKHGVDVASKIWLALVTVHVILYFGKDLGK